jgi:hypothetical protein
MSDELDADYLDARAGDRPLPKRPVEHLPHNPSCPLHLQRICGTCTHYQGKLRPNLAAGEFPHAECARLTVQKSRRANAWNCRHWARKSGGAGDA